MRSPLYFHPWLYELAIRALYGQYYQARYREVAALIPEGSRVVDVCAGDCGLYRHALRTGRYNYHACDSNKTFVEWAQRQGIQAQRLDVLQEPLPKADCVVMMGSLCQFLPEPGMVLESMIEAAHERVIISEPVRNLAQHRWGMVRWLARLGSQLESGPVERRFTEETLRALLKRYGLESMRPVAGGREVLAFLEQPGA